MSFDIVIAPVIDRRGLHYRAYSRTERDRMFRTISFEYEVIELRGRAKDGWRFDRVEDIQNALIVEYGTRVNIVEWEGIR